MNPELNNEELVEVTKEKHPVFKVTTVSKYLALALFVLLPFLGGYIGYVYAPEQVVEVVREVERETSKNEFITKVDATTTPSEFLSQQMWFWKTEVNTKKQIKILAPIVIENVPQLEINAPENWLVSQSGGGAPEYTKTIRLTDPEYPGKFDTDVPSAYFSLTFAKDIDTCAGTYAFSSDSISDSNLSSNLALVYDSGWNEGWADLPTRTVCIDAISEYGESILLQLYPISESNKSLFDEMIQELKVI